MRSLGSLISMMTSAPVSCKRKPTDERSSKFDQSGVAAPPITSFIDEIAPPVKVDSIAYALELPPHQMHLALPVLPRETL